ncbi:vacuolar sorting-associated protein 36 [Babesia ovis]|uniref:Vacuolar protein-sorting-associated protein 36 n=1 Tax=Babesia ovis TaxID=5869 RepID=A0A9W5T9I8_BABOV|nr:vacuolar sorting-associated protein 36 [Babesia ovis]
MECKVEEEVLKLDGLGIRNGIMGRLKVWNEATLTSNRLYYKDGNVEKSIPISTIRECQIKRRGMQRCIKIKCIDVVYYVTYDGDLDHLYQELMKVLQMHETYNVIGRSDAMGGVSRVVQMKNERIESADQLRTNVMVDLDSLKKKSKKIREMARHLCQEERTLSKTFEALNLNVFEDEGGIHSSDEAEEVVIRLLKDHDFILLQDLFCMVNRMRVCNLITAKEVRAQVESLQERGMCKLVDIQGVSTIVANDVEHFLEDIAKIVAKGPITPLQLAEIQGISVSLAEYKLVYAELKGVVARDDGTYHVRYYYNPFCANLSI